MIFRSLEHQVRGHGHSVIDLEGGFDEVLHLKAFGKDLGVEIRLDDTHKGIVIATKEGIHRQELE